MSDKSTKTTFPPLTSSAEDSHARTSACQEKGQAWMVTAPACSLKCSVSFASCGPDYGSWKTSQQSLIGGWTTYSKAWHKQGIMLDGAAFEHPTWVLPNVESDGFASGGWPTPQKMDGDINYRKDLDWFEKRKELAKIKRKELVKIKRQQNPQRTSRVEVRPQRTLQIEVQRWLTPIKSDYKGSSKPSQRKGQLTEALEPNNLGKLNPDWVELLQGFPPGWTSLPQDGLPPLAPHMDGNHPEPTPSNPKTKDGYKH